ncbi:hypothetical protein [Planktothricoides raciborskii]|uniref:Uncharacterized protein n=1 Tax=Planktothricoides raciborskii FACHB-1370 TaxID=2949576 RepID=A0ABR8EH60_9CYAN|nr:hypothetical protein [Planktothricoides raciborskii]MBD2545782.1 hypothetical protein [Planktothricoides raciborskii FACHB-1370]MBD2583997.1 hypothetical protein [Planktothricoides raciborskii FACHB-1261]
MRFRNRVSFWQQPLTLITTTETRFLFSTTETRFLSPTQKPGFFLGVQKPGFFLATTVNRNYHHRNPVS